MSRLRRRREALGLRREELAVKAETSFETVKRLEAEGDAANTSVKIARGLARVLKTSIEQLFPGDGAADGARGARE